MLLRFSGQIAHFVEEVPLAEIGQGVIELRVERTIPQVSSRLRRALYSVLGLLYLPRPEAAKPKNERLNV